MNGVFQLEKIIKDTALMADDYRCFLMNVKTTIIILAYHPRCHSSCC